MTSGQKGEKNSNKLQFLHNHYMFIVKWSKMGKGFKKYKNTTLFMKYPQFCSSVGWMRTYVALYIFPCYNIPTYRGYFFLQVAAILA